MFFALWPDDATRAAIVRATREPVRLSRRPARAKDRLHVTVAFLGALTEAGLEIARGVPPIEVGAFDLALDRLGAFANGGVLWLGPRTVPPALGSSSAGCGRSSRRAASFARSASTSRT